MNSVKSAARSRLSLLLLFAVFAAPVVLAWLLFYVFPEWKPSATANHGALVEPLRQLPPFQFETQAGNSINETFLRGKWTLVYLHSGSCADACIDQLFKIRQIRLAQGKNIDRLQRLLLWDDSGVSDEEATALAAHFPGLVIVSLADRTRADLRGVFSLDEQTATAAGRVYLVDPLGNLMMFYQHSDFQSREPSPKSLLKQSDT